MTALATVVGLAVASPAQAASNTLAPSSITTATGSVGGGQTVSNLVARDQTGTRDDWGKYVEFRGAYSGYRSYVLPSSVLPGTVSSIQVSANYRGPASAQQTWTWSLYNWSTSTWTAVGTNSTASAWSSWKLLTFTASSGASAFVNPSGSIRVQVKASNSSDAADIDFESVVVTSASSGGGSAVSIPMPNAKFSYQLGGAYTPESGVKVVSRDRTEPSAGAGFYNICYVNLLQTQPDEPGQSSTNPPYGTTRWWINNYPDLLLKNAGGRVIVDADWNEALFDVRTAAKRSQLLSVQSAWFQKCKTDGFQAVEPDNLDAHLRSTGLISFAQTKEYLKLVVPKVHRIGLAIAQKNTSDSPGGYGLIGKSFVDTVSPAQGFDFAIAEECAAYKECSKYTDVYNALVFEIEYTDNNPDQTRAGVTKTAFTWICQDDGAARSIILRDRGVVPAGTSGYSYREC